jgi:HAMP domain-containing protein
MNKRWLICIAALLGMIFGVIISNSIANPLGFLTRLARAISVGDLVWDVSEAEKDKVRLRKDEIGEISKAFDALINYMQGMGVAATSISNNDLTVSITAKSPKDELGTAVQTAGVTRKASSVEQMSRAIDGAMGPKRSRKLSSLLAQAMKGLLWQ